MKKLLSVMMAILALATVTFAFAGCNKAEIPEGYKLYEYWEEGVSFAIPETWSASNAGITIIQDENSMTGENITVTPEPLTSGYKNLTTEVFNTQIKAPLQASGLNVGTPTIEQKDNGAVDVCVVKYSVSTFGISMQQVMYAVNSKSKTFVIVITLPSPNDELVENVFNTIRVD